MRAVRIEVISKAPPGGRCEIYDRLFFEVVKACENVSYSLIPVNISDREVSPPAFLINGEEIRPEDGVLLTPQELLSALKKHGAIFREGEERVLEVLNSIYGNLTGG